VAFTVVIPARYASSRLPGKPLADIGGKPMIHHVYEQACRSRADRVLVATDDERIEGACQGFGAEVVMTSPDHASGTDRLQEVVTRLGLGDDACVVNVQGDEPLIPPALIDQVADALESYRDAAISTLCERIHDPSELFNPNVVKVVRDHDGYAHYFSRAPVPWSRSDWQAGQVPEQLPDDYQAWRHIGIYGYRVSLLHRFVAWPPAPTELTESLEQLRALYQGARIHVSEALEQPPAGVDTPEDLERVRQWLTLAN
jgi:3-deoxy-manno-octulosonate cytidylyltransferase (CMP-KDO synthetase)